MKSSSHSARFVSFLAITLAAIPAAHATTTLNSAGGWTVSGTASNGELVTSGPASINSVTLGRGLGGLAGNVGVGINTIVSVTTGNYLTAVGPGALRYNTTGQGNVAIGYTTLNLNTTASYNTGLGYSSLKLNTIGAGNSAVGAFSLAANTTGSQNSALGQGALYVNTTGSTNSAYGYSSLSANTTGAFNTGLGANALYNNLTGNDNVAVGADAGSAWANGTTPLTDAVNSIYIGSGARGKDDNDDNSIVIGTDAIGEGANTTVIGNSSTVTTHLYGTVVLDAAQGDISMGDYED